MIDFCRGHLSRQALKDAFILTYDSMRRYGGAWHVEQKPMFPGYILLESEDGKRLAEELKESGRFVSREGDRNVLMKLEDHEAEFLQKLCGREHHLRMSRGYIKGGQTYVTEGPLQGQERLIRKIDRHRRMAWVEVPGRFRSQGGWFYTKDTRRLPDGSMRREMYAGLEIVSKSPEETVSGQP